MCVTISTGVALGRLEQAQVVVGYLFSVFWMLKFLFALAWMLGQLALPSLILLIDLDC
jgi:hypothetical protein